MNFLAPAALFFGLAIPVVIVFYLLKRKRVVKLISSTLLWERFLAETQASKPFQRLRHNWLLLIQILILALVVLALARPYFSGMQKGGQRRVMILDVSASMQSTDEKPTRLDKAREEALKFVGTLMDNDETVVLQAGANTEVKQSATSDKAALRRAIQSCAPSDSPTRFAEAFKLAETLIKDRSGAEIHLFSDGAWPQSPDFNKDLPITYHKFGQRGQNLGIVSLDVRPNPDNFAERAIFATIANFSSNAWQTELELLFDGELVQARPLNLPPTNSQPIVLTAPQTNDGVFTIRLTSKDDLPADDQASILSLIPQPANVLLLTRGNRFLEQALRALPQVRLNVASVLTDDASAFDMVIMDDVIPAVWPKVNTLAIHTVSTNWFPTWTTVTAPAIVDWKNTHQILRYVNFDNVSIAETFGVKTPSWGVSLVESPQTPLILAGELGGRRLLWVGFDTLQSSWPLRISFPIFIANAVDWLNPSAANASQFLVRPGEPFRFRAAQPVQQAKVTKPDGTVVPVSVTANGTELSFGDTLRQGVYKLQADTNTVRFCVALLDPAESSTTPREELPFGRFTKVTPVKLRRANQELWRWLALGGLCIVIFEWWYYHRRTA